MAKKEKVTMKCPKCPFTTTDFSAWFDTCPHCGAKLELESPVKTGKDPKHPGLCYPAWGKERGKWRCRECATGPCTATDKVAAELDALRSKEKGDSNESKT